MYANPITNTYPHTCPNCGYYCQGHSATVITLYPQTYGSTSFFDHHVVDRRIKTGGRPPAPADLVVASLPIEEIKRPWETPVVRVRGVAHAKAVWRRTREVVPVRLRPGSKAA